MNWISNSHLIKPPACSYFHRYPKAAVRGTAFSRALLCQIEFLAACTFPLPALLLPALLPPPPTSPRIATPIKQLFQSPSASSVFLHKITYPFFKVIWPFQCQASCCQCFVEPPQLNFGRAKGGGMEQHPWDATPSPRMRCLGGPGRPPGPPAAINPRSWCFAIRAGIDAWEVSPRKILMAEGAWPRCNDPDSVIRGRGWGSIPGPAPTSLEGGFADQRNGGG